MINLSAIRHLIIDMDGVLWHGDRCLPQTPYFFATLRELGIRFVLATNNASKSVEEYQSKLAGFGVPVAPDEIMTSPQATAAYLRQHAPNARVYVIGEAGLVQELQRQELTVVPPDQPAGATHVVVGWDRSLTYAKLAEACLLIRAGATFIGTNPDVTYPDVRGIIPGNGATLALLRAATDVEPLIIGKPQPYMIVQSMERMGGAPTDTAVVGDRLDTDIAGGQRAGLRTILVLSGVTDRRLAESSPIQADAVFEHVGELADALKATRRCAA
ncbi:MAG: HAD-IIA family hydrolase [Anaerolineae bacterium]|nr:HAD-IIA family hydrolase [Thermoflexales bacterium]MDW8407434.1 HAD-IIA family hydrolase [Anaerolineae bacterium]